MVAPTGSNHFFAVVSRQKNTPLSMRKGYCRFISEALT